MEKVINKVSFKEDFIQTKEFWLSKTYLERLDALEYLREDYKNTFLKKNERGFQRVLRIIDRRKG
ncbi:TPA: hypothetical protein DCW38_00455 [candidate division WOR-3 bacterium]|jgi:hypothetical protein|uniref:Uncharacterized protein n=1 Tax=candidate division WOR-3 bacterium TaxID=2052148 RepID=A0A350H7Y1_UNCW3|nr:hypothetical protein [candidate division WOR-3 bacterium]